MAFDGMRATVIPRQANTLSPAIPFVGKHVISPRLVSDPAATLLAQEDGVAESSVDADLV